MYKFSKRSLDNLVGIHPDLLSVLHEAITNSTVDFTITEGVRTVDRQYKLYCQGRKTPGGIVTNIDGLKNKSNHQVKSDGYGYAVDLYPYVNGKVQVNDVKSLTVIGNHIKNVAKTKGINVEWGGDWKMRDYPHFELKK